VHTLVGGGGLHEGFDALDYRKIKHGDDGKLGNYPILSICKVPMSFMISGLQVSIFHPGQLIEAILMCMEPSILIRFGSSCTSAPACKLLSLLSLLSLIQVTAF
jgi:hypothetical protein